MVSNTSRGVIVTLVSAFVLEKALEPLKGPFWFVGVFLGVYIIAVFCFRSNNVQLTAYFEDALFSWRCASVLDYWLGTQTGRFQCTQGNTAALGSQQLYLHW